jgi:hypothetical protein
MQAFFDALAESTTFVVVAAVAAVLAVGVLLAGAGRWTRMDNAALSATLAAAWRADLDSEPVAPLDVPALIVEARARNERATAFGHGHRPVDENRSIGRCEPCDRSSFLSRKAARRAMKANHPGDAHMSAYPCPAQDVWHYGHRPSGGRDLLRWRRERAS